MKVLLVEDDPEDVKLLRRILIKADTTEIELETVSQVSAGRERLALGGIDLVILDLMLPDSQGLDTLSSIQQSAPAVPIVILTGLDDEEIGLTAVRQGAQDYIVKSRISAENFPRAIRYAVERKKMEETLRAQKEELERLNKIMMDREDRILELKQEIKDLRRPGGKGEPTSP
ncbi:MAG: response regulator [Candidatus Omnitrophica bacterium]|nr:response regulator [Candidatus Omnitrophota bacterium]